MIGCGTNCATEASSGGALEAWKPSAASLMATDCAPGTVLAGTAGIPLEGAGTVLLATALVGAAAGVEGGGAAEAGAGAESLSESESDALSASAGADLDPASTSAISSGDGAAPGGGAAVSAPARSATAL